MSTAAWRRGVEDLHREAAGLVRVHVLHPLEGTRVVMAAAMGDRYCGALLIALAESTRSIQRAVSSDPMLCLCCPVPITDVRGVTLVLAVPDTAAQSPEINVNVIEALRGLWPDLRPITIAPTVGRA